MAREFKFPVTVSDPGVGVDVVAGGALVGAALVGAALVGAAVVGV